MKIRSITCFFNPAASVLKATMKHLTEFTSEAVSRFQDAGYEVQTTRLATAPFPYLLKSLDFKRACLMAQGLEAEAEQYGFSYLSLGPALPDFPDSYDLIPRLLAETKNVFFSGQMAAREYGVNMQAVQACARIIHTIAPLSPDGFTNLRFAALGNVPAGAPFFPAAYHNQDRLTFALAVESADSALNAFSNADSIAEGRKALLANLEGAGQILSRISSDLSEIYNLNFGGIDFSLAPFPQDWCSLGGVMEKIGVQKIGFSGSLAAAAIIADTLDQGRWPRAGFNGLMLPVLEDSILAKRSEEGILTVRDLLLFSTVCGTGLDTVPLPGDITVDELAALLADVAALSVRLDKPLTARLMPVPEKKAGEPTGFDFSFFANGGIIPLSAAPLTGLLAKGETFSLHRKP